MFYLLGGLSVLFIGLIALEFRNKSETKKKSKEEIINIFSLAFSTVSMELFIIGKVFFVEDIVWIVNIAFIGLTFVFCLLKCIVRK